MERRPATGTGISTSLSGIGVDDETELDGPAPNRDRLIVEACDLADAHERPLVALYWRLVPDEELFDRSPRDMLRATRQHRSLAEQRLPGELRLQVTTPPEGHTTIDVVTDDMPFLVDSVTAALAGAGLDIHLLVHPQVVVTRETLGRLEAVYPEVKLAAVTGDQIVESWIRLEIDRVGDEDQLDALRNRIQRILTDVREVNEDSVKLRERALSLADELTDAKPPVPDKDITDAVDLLRWLAADNFTILGYREYELVDGDYLQARLGSGLGILRADSPARRPLSSMTPEAYAKALDQRLLTITKANSRSTVHRTAYLDYIGIKEFNEAGNVIGERRFLGLFGSGAYLHSVRDLPVVRRKVAEVITRSGLSPRSHSGKDLMAILETYPRDELFQIATNDLFTTAMGVLRLAGRRQVKLFLRKDAYGRFISCMVYLPRDRFTTANRLRIQEILVAELNGIGVDYATRVSESMLARVHFIVRTDPTNPPGDINVDTITEQLSDATRLWDDDFRLLLERKVGEGREKRLYSRYVDAYPQTYKDEHTPTEAAKDIAKLELIDSPGELALHLFRRRKNDADLRFKVFRYGEPMRLSAVLPMLHSLGFQVTDERPYEIEREDGTVYLYDFGLIAPPESSPAPEIRATVENAFHATWYGEAEVDGFNQLVIRAGLSWRQVVVLRAYAKYLRQAGTIFSQEYVEGTFIAYPGIATLLVALFETRFDPRLGLTEEARASHAEDLVAALEVELDQVTSLDQDRILRSFLNLIQATLRTSFFQRSTSGVRPKSYVAFKLNPEAVPDLPQPRPKYEIWVYSPRFEGVHLRFGAVARGGLRWSDRREDFRTEILGLVKAQMVKNAVIVPVGSKGGFVLKQAPAAADRDAFFAEGVACYKLFISALLDVTDNLVAGKIVPPADVVRHDTDDPYLVVAADKGTATFSDTANEISENYGFWLGDAFASGGSAGYDHKKMGITARGAWESVKRHFRDMGINSQTQDFTVVGIGDMSGDVFGNGMLLSQHIRLVAAFDHRHIFLDPEPTAAISFAERQRMFELPRSSWDDYDKSLISAGGGVYPRTAKSIPISPQVRLALGLPGRITELSPPELMKAILKAPVDLLWNGGIGTYIKSSAESNSDVGDKSNDALRVNGKELRAKVVGEGGNLGLTQRGRIEFALAGGRINTDAIDNSAGVDCSDHEVNIKILLNGVVQTAELDIVERNALLAEMTDEVAELVLADNYGQATALGNSQAQAHSLLPVHRRMISDLERSGRLHRDLEALPTDEVLDARDAAGLGLTSPELAVLLAYVKIALEDEILASGLPDEAWTADVLSGYFPGPLRERYAAQMSSHPLRREIVTTVLVNEIVNRSGISFVYRAVEETGADAADILRAYIVVRDVFGLRDLWRAVEKLDNQVPTETQTGVLLEARRLMDRVVRWLVQNRRVPLDVPGEIARLRPGVSKLLPELGTLFRGVEREALRQYSTKLTQRGIPEDLADWVTRLMYGFGLMDIVEVTQTTGQDLDVVAGVYFVLSERFRVDELLTRISNLPRLDRWQTLARMALRYDLYAALAALTAEVLTASGPELDPEKRADLWEQVNAASIARARNAIGEFDDSRADLAALSVLLRQIRTLVRASSS